MPREGAYIMRSGSFEATISASEGNITFGHSGSVKFIDAASGSVAELTSSVSGSVMHTEFVLGERVADKPFWVFKPDGRMQYSRGGTTKVTEVDMNEKFLIASRSSHDAAKAFEHMEVKERDKTDEKTTIESDNNTFAKGLIVSGAVPFVSLYDTDDGSITKMNATIYQYVSGGAAEAWTIGNRYASSIAGVGVNCSYWGGQAQISISTPPETFWFSSSGDFWTKGTISGSGINLAGTSTFGEVVNLVGEDPRLRLKAVGANHPGVEWHEDSTRKWVLYNDPDASDKLVFKNDTTDLVKITQDGAVGVSDSLYHINDTDTKITFTADDINIQAGGVNFIDITEGANNEITFNEAGAASSVDIDFRVEGTGDANLLLTDAGTDKVGIGTNKPPKKLTVSGDISASGHYYLGLAKNIHFAEGDTTGREYKIQTNNSGLTFTSGSTTHMLLKNGGGTNFVGEVSSSGGFLGGPTQNTGSYDFPGAIMGYTCLGKNLAHESYTLTTSYAVPDDKFNVVFVAPKSGKVEINFAGGLFRDSSSSTLNYHYLGLSDAATYNALQTYYEQSIGHMDESGFRTVNHNWVVDGLTPGDTYQYWIGMRTSSATTQYFLWGGNASNRNPDVIIKVTALPSNADIES